MKSNEITVITPDLEFQVQTPRTPSPIEYQLSRLEQLTEEEIGKENVDDVLEIKNRADAGLFLSEYLRKAKMDKELQLRGFKLWALNTHQLGFLFKKGLIDREKAEQISSKTREEARILNYVDSKELRERIDTLALERRLTQVTKTVLLLNLQGKEPSRGAEPLDRELVVLVELLDRIIENKDYFIRADYTSASQFKRRIQTDRMREAYRIAFKKLIEVLD